MNTTITRKPTRQETFAAMATLQSRGWVQTMSIMDDQAKVPGYTTFGIVFERGGEEFYLNYKTIGNLPD